MRSLSLLDATKHTSPNPVSLICSLTPDGRTNLATVSWWTCLSLEPETIGFAMMKPSYTGELVRGSTTGRTQDKATTFDIALMELPDCAIRIPVHSVVAIQCRLREHIDVGDHYFYICDVERVLADADEAPLFAWKGYARIAPARQACPPLTGRHDA